MEIRFPRLMARARRMIAGVFEDPKRPLGSCRYCDETVLYAEGDTDPEGRPRHDRCEREVTRRQLDRVSADRIFLHVLGLVRGLPSVVKPGRDALRAMPDRCDARDMAAFIDAMLPHVELEPMLTLRSRRDTIVALRGAKRSLLGLDLGPGRNDEARLA
ncbi:MAG TPA: hypothetical protein VL426_06560 [Candidatus Binatia bacterium]|nr:hypothetical protein [Candidatus Binatia bacterium]